MNDSALAMISKLFSDQSMLPIFRISIIVLNFGVGKHHDTPSFGNDSNNDKILSFSDDICYLSLALR